MQEQEFYAAAKALITDSEGRILVLKASGGDYWDLPGGRVKAGETLRDALKREIMEELGSEVAIEGLFDACIANSAAKAASLLMVIYNCRLHGSEIALNDENEEYRWATADEAKSMIRRKFPESFLEKLGAF